MVMKIITYVLAALLLAAVAAGAFFYFTIYTPMIEDYAQLKSSIPALTKAKAELKQLKDSENKETAWINPAINALSAGLAPEIGAGAAEVLSADRRVIVNIGEDRLFQHGSYTFSKDSTALRDRLVELLKKSELQGKDVYIGNTTDSVPAQGRGRRRIPAKDARTLSADRSAALIKDLEKNGISPNVLIAAAYASNTPDIGFKLKDHKTVIIIEDRPVPPAVASKPASTAAKPAAIPIQPKAR